MRCHLDVVERRWRALAMNKKATTKLRKAAIERMQFPTDAYLCRLLKGCKGHPALEFQVTERLAALRKKAFEQSLVSN